VGRVSLTTEKEHKSQGDYSLGKETILRWLWEAQEVPLFLRTCKMGTIVRFMKIVSRPAISAVSEPHRIIHCTVLHRAAASCTVLCRTVLYRTDFVEASCLRALFSVTAACNGRPLSVTAAEIAAALFCNGRL